MKCNLCPKNCNVNRSVARGACKSGELVTICRIAPHFWEEPCLSGTHGSGTVFFGGCNLRCRFCQNYEISATGGGVEISAERLADVLVYVGGSGLENVNLVSPSQFSDKIAFALKLAKPLIAVPVVYNTNSYEKVEALRALEGLVDVYLPDFKFCSSALSLNMCGAADYFEVARAAIAEMLRQQPKNLYREGMLQRGVIVRHLVLPSHAEDSKCVLDALAQMDGDVTVSLMAQYFPTHTDSRYPELNRKLFRHEYDNVRQYFFNVGLKNGYMQEAEAATEDYVPNFDLDEARRTLEQIPHIFTVK